MSKTALIVTHKAHEDIGSFKTTLEDRRFLLDQRLGYHDTLAEEDPLHHDVAIFMGGTMGVYQADLFPYLNNEISYLKKRIEAGKPTLGVCLGAQMIAAASGEKVYRGENGIEIGWQEVTVNEEGMKTSLKHFDQRKTKMPQWHGDTFDLPNEAVLLASSAQYTNQAFKIGENIMGVQFHPEITLDIMECWMVSGVNSFVDMGITIPALRADSKKNGLTLEQQTKAFLNDWLDEVLPNA